MIRFATEVRQEPESHIHLFVLANIAVHGSARIEPSHASYTSPNEAEYSCDDVEEAIEDALEEFDEDSPSKRYSESRYEFDRRYESYISRSRSHDDACEEIKQRLGDEIERRYDYIIQISF